MEAGELAALVSTVYFVDAQGVLGPAPVKACTISFRKTLSFHACLISRESLALLECLQLQQGNPEVSPRCQGCVSIVHEPSNGYTVRIALSRCLQCIICVLISEKEVPRVSGFSTMRCTPCKDNWLRVTGMRGVRANSAVGNCYSCS